jgi:hypothetical protein
VGRGSQDFCAHHHETVASDVINIQYTHGITVRHMTLTWQNVDSDGIHLSWQQSGKGDVVECNTFHDKVKQINNRSYPRGAAISDMENVSSQPSATYQYNTIVGSPQGAIVLGAQVPVQGSVVQYNDIDQGYYQAPPYTSKLQMYSNDYAINAPGSGTVAYNYIHSVSGRGIDMIFSKEANGTAIYGNYVSSGEMAANGEYGPNGKVNGGAWVGGCEIDGGRGFEAKETVGVSVYSNTFIVNVQQCGGGGMVFVGFPCTDVSCPASASRSFNVHDNTIQIVNSSGSSTLSTPQQVACYIFDEAQGNYRNYFAPFLRDHCSSDGDFVATDAYDPGNYIVFANPTWTIGNHRLSSGCGGSGLSCGHLMHWEGVQAPPVDELGFVFQDVSLGNGASINFEGDAIGGAPLARAATVQWTYTPTVLSSATGLPVSGATVSAISAKNNHVQCTTNSSGQCSAVLRQEVVSSPVGNKTLTKTSENPYTVQIRATGCAILNYNLTVTALTSESRTLTCVPPSVNMMK